MSTSQGRRYEPSGKRRLFLSYARDDREFVRPIEEGVEVLQHELWMDKRIHAGHLWWNEILEQIRQCDAMIVAISPALLESEAAKRERFYAQQLKKPIIPVVVAPVRNFPSDISPVQMIDYIKNPSGAPFHLAGLLSGLPPAPPLPNPIPVPPPRPPDIISELSEKVHQPYLSNAEQIELLMNLRTAVAQSRTHAGAIGLLNQLKDRGDLPHNIVREADEILQRHKKPPPGVTGPGTFIQPQAPPRRLVLSLVAVVLTFWPLLTIPGLISLYFSSQVSTRWKLKDYDGARKASTTALVVSYVGMGINLLFVFGSSGSTSTTMPY
jgi:hypothetical protein